MVASLEISAQDEEGQFLVDLLLVGLGLEYLEDEPSSFLILFVFPLGFDALLEELDGVDFAEGFANEVAE